MRVIRSSEDEWLDVWREGCVQTSAWEHSDITRASLRPRQRAVSSIFIRINITQSVRSHTLSTVTKPSALGQEGTWSGQRSVTQKPSHLTTAHSQCDGKGNGESVWTVERRKWLCRVKICQSDTGPELRADLNNCQVTTCSCSCPLPSLLSPSKHLTDPAEDYRNYQMRGYNWNIR